MTDKPSNPLTALAGGPGGARRRLLVLAAVAVATLLLHLPALDTDTFITHEDTVLRTPLVSHVRNVPKIFGEAFTLHTGGVYRPFAYAVLATVRTVVPADPSGSFGTGAVLFWHLWLAGFHVLNALLIYAVARHFTSHAPVALLAVGVFLVHPLGSAFVGQIDLFPYVLGGTLTLGSLAAYLHHIRTRRAWSYALSLGLFACGLFTSRAVLALPALLLAVELLHARTHPVRALMRVLPFAACAVWPVILFVRLRPHPLFYVYPPKAHQSAAWYWAYGFCAGGVDTLRGLVTGWSTPVPIGGITGGIDGGWNSRALFAGMLLVVALVAAAWALLRRRWTFVGFFLVTLGASGRFHSELNMVADHAAWQFRYVPLVGFALLMAALVEWLHTPPSRTWRRILLTSTAAALVVWGALLVAANVRTRSAVDWWDHARRANGESQRVSVMLGKAWLNRGDTREAMNYLFGPQVRSVRLSCLAMGRHYTDAGEPLAAMVHFHIAQRENVYRFTARQHWRARAALLLRENALDYAEQLLGQLLMAEPDDGDALKHLAEVFARKGYLRAAVRCADDAARLDPSDDAATDLRAELRRRLYNPERYDRPVGTTTPPDPAWLRYANDDKQGDLVADRVIGLADAHTADPIVQLSAGILLARRGKGDEAIRRLDRTLATLSHYTYAWATKCWIAARTGKRSLALETFKEAKQQGLGDALTWHTLGIVLNQEKQTGLAIKAFETALIAKPDLAESHNNIGLLLVRPPRGRESREQRNERYRKARDHFKQALALPRKRRSGAHNGLAVALMNLDDLDGAIAHFKTAIAIDPTRESAYHFMAWAYEYRKDYYGSVRTLALGLKRLPKSVVLRIHLALLYAASPDPGVLDGKRAVTLAKGLCAEKHPPPPEMLDLLAASYAQAGDFPNAIETINKAIARARESGEQRLVLEFTEKRSLYQNGIPFRLGPGPQVRQRYGPWS